MSQESLSEEHIHENQTKTQTLLYASFMHGEHSAFKKHMENNPVRQNFDSSLANGIAMASSKERTLSDIAPTLIILLQNGAKLAHDHLIMRDGMTPYHAICSSPGDHQELLELMIKELGRRLVNVKDDIGCTALMYAVINANIKCVKRLIAIGADVNLINDQHTTGDNGPLIDSIVLLHPNYRHSYNTMMGIFDLLLDSGADVNKPCFYRNRTPIMYAAMVGNANCVEKLIQKGAQVNHIDSAGHTVEVGTLAARAGSVDVLKCLIEDHGIDKNSIDKNGLSLLYWAVHSGNIEIVRYLLKLGVTMTSFVPQERVEACKDCGKNILCYHFNATQLYTDPYVKAIKYKMLDVVRLMDEYGCELYKSLEFLSYAISADSVDVVEYLLSNYKYPLNYGYTVRYNDSSLDTGHQHFLIKACKTRSVKLVKLLLEHGADPNKKHCVDKCPNVLNAAIFGRHVKITVCFIRGGVNVNTRSYYPDIGVVLPFEAAVYKNHMYAAEMLLVSGCSCGIHSLDNNYRLKDNIGREMKELLKEWNVHKNNVLPLQQRCRMVILNHLCPQADKKIIELPLPTILIKYLSIPELDDIVDSFMCKL